MKNPHTLNVFDLFESWSKITTATISKTNNRLLLFLLFCSLIKYIIISFNFWRNCKRIKGCLWIFFIVMDLHYGRYYLFSLLLYFKFEWFFELYKNRTGIAISRCRSNIIDNPSHISSDCKIIIGLSRSILSPWTIYPTRA